MTGTQSRQNCDALSYDLPRQVAFQPPMVDIHCHILPGFDDGAKTLEESLAMAEIAAANGVGTIIATPHVADDREALLSHRIEESVGALQAAIDLRGIDIRILPGAEVFPSTSALKWLDADYPIALTKGGNHILLDCSFTTMPVGMEDLVFRLKARGITPILAHPERVLPIQQNPRLLEDLVHNGMLVQIDALSLLGKFGPAAAAVSRVLLSHRWVHFLASDAHSPNHSRPRLAEAAQLLARSIGQETVRELVENNPNRLLRGEPIPTDPADYAPIRNYGIFSSILRFCKAA